MRSRWFLTSTLLIGAWALGAWIAGCSKKTTAPKPPSEKVNEDKPNANPRIRSQTIFGDPGRTCDLGLTHRALDARLSAMGDLLGDQEREEVARAQALGFGAPLEFQRHAGGPCAPAMNRAVLSGKGCYRLGGLAAAGTILV